MHTEDDFIEMKGIKIQGRPMYLDMQVTHPHALYECASSLNRLVPWLCNAAATGRQAKLYLGQLGTPQSIQDMSGCPAGHHPH